jgi:hypothetical protein
LSYGLAHLDFQAARFAASCLPENSATMQAGLGPKRLARRKTKHLVLPGPLRWQVGEASNPHAVGQPATDGRLDEVGSKESQRDRHVDLSRAAVFPFGDTVRTR